MSTFPDGGRPGKAVDNSNFTQTCNLLSKFLKDKRTSAPLLTLPLPFTAKTEDTTATVDLLPNLQNSDDASRQSTLTMDFLPQFVENPCIIKWPSLRSSLPFPESESETSQPQLTIFYGGKVLVFDAFPPDKATEVMELATRLASESDHFGNPTTTTTTTTATTAAPFPLATENSSTALQPPRSGPQAFGSDMRYPRRASLLKFLEKRKERVIAKGPYHMNNPKYEESSSGGDQPEHQCSKHFDLNL